jgi:2-isopropylmalate synthase
MTATHKTSVHKGRAPKTAVTKSQASKTHASSPSDAEGKAASAKDRVIIFDTTLRDGEQSPGATMTFEEKLEVADLLDEMGVDVIEAGFPIASQGDFEAVHAVAKRAKHAVIAGLSRANAKDIDRCAEAVRPARRGRIHTVIATSPLHMKAKLQMEPEAVLQAVIDSVTRARNHIDDVEWSCEDGTRSEVDFLCRCVEAAIKAGATTVNIPDTVGYTTPEEYSDYFRRLYELVPGLREVEVSVHCHDDLGLAVANSYAGVLAGARQVECAINGIGERAGNCSLEEIAMLVNVREDVHGLRTGINTRELARTSRMVSRLTGYAIQPNKAIVGRNAFAHESGIHQDGVLKERTTYEIMDATEVGLESNSIVLGKHSGRHALRDALDQLGFKVEGNALNAAFKRFKEVADRKKQVTALDLEAIVSDEMREKDDSHELAWFEVEAGSRKDPLARVAVKMPSGEEAVGESGGDGPVDAIFRAIQKAVDTECELRQYTVEAVTGGEDALGQVTVMLRAAGRLATGQGVATDILEASARAYVRAPSNALEGAAIREAEAVTSEAAVERTPGP